MNKRIIGILICILVSLTMIIPALAASENTEKVNIQPLSNDRTHILIYVDTSGIDDLPELNTTEKEQLKRALIAHIWANFNETVGPENVTVTNDPSQAGNANRTIRMSNTVGGTVYYLADGRTVYEFYYGEWLHGRSEVTVFLRTLIALDAADYKDNGVWNITRLANALGRTAAHEVAHSYCVGHNHRNGEDVSKMTAGELVNSTTRATHDWHFDDHTREVLRNNWGRPPCASTTDYDQRALVVNFNGPTDIPEKSCEFESVDALFSYSGELVYFFEFGWLGVDTDNGEIDGNPYFDFIYKSSMVFDPDQDADVITFLMGNSNKVQFLLRGTPGSPWESQWFPLEEDNVVLSNFISVPGGKEIAREVAMSWDINNDGDADITIELNSLCYTDYNNPYNGFTYEVVYPNNLPNTPDKPDGPTTGKPGIEYTYSFTAIDPDGDRVMFNVDWGDGLDSLWIGPYDSGEIVTATHTWDKKGSYNVKAMVRDANFAESDWSDPLTVTMPRNRALYDFNWMNLLERFPTLYKVFSQLI